MKIYTKIVIDIDTGETIAEESFEYDGPVALAMPSTGGSRSGSGGDDTGHDAGRSGGGSGSGGGDSGGGMGGYGGFGGIGIGNPGSYGGQQSVGAPGFSGGYDGAAPSAGGAETGNLMNTIADYANPIGSILGIAGMLTGNPALGMIGLGARGLSALSNLAGNLDSDFSGMSAPGGPIDTGAAFNGPGGNDMASNGFVSANDLGGLYQLFQQALGGGAVPGAPAAAPPAPGINQGYNTGNLSDQMYALWQGENAPYNPNRVLADYLTHNQGATQNFVNTADNLSGEWRDFENRYRNAGAALTDDYQGVQDRYQRNMYQIQPMSVTLPGSMGGAAISLAPNRWGTFYGNQAQTEAGLVGERAGMLDRMANYDSTGMGNRMNLAGQRFQNILAGNQNTLLPFNQAAGTLAMDKGFSADRALQQDRIDAATPDDLAVWAPIAVDILDTVGKTDWGNVGNAVSGAVDWLGGLF